MRRVCMYVHIHVRTSHHHVDDYDYYLNSYQDSAGFSLKLDREVLHHSGLLENTLMWCIDYFDVGFLIRQNHNFTLIF